MRVARRTTELQSDVNEIVLVIARALARQAADEDDAAEQQLLPNGRYSKCVAPSTPVTARTSKTSGR